MREASGLYTVTGGHLTMVYWLEPNDDIYNKRLQDITILIYKVKK